MDLTIQKSFPSVHSHCSSFKSQNLRRRHQNPAEAETLRRHQSRHRMAVLADYVSAVAFRVAASHHCLVHPKPGTGPYGSNRGPIPGCDGPPSGPPLLGNGKLFGPIKFPPTPPIGFKSPPKSPPIPGMR